MKLTVGPPFHIFFGSVLVFPSSFPGTFPSVFPSSFSSAFTSVLTVPFPSALSSTLVSSLLSAASSVLISPCSGSGMGTCIVAGFKPSICKIPLIRDRTGAYLEFRPSKITPTAKSSSFTLVLRISLIPFSNASLSKSLPRVAPFCFSSLAGFFFPPCCFPLTRGSSFFFSGSKSREYTSKVWLDLFFNATCSWKGVVAFGITGPTSASGGSKLRGGI